MALGPGKYDDIASWVREQTKGDTVLVMVLGGIKGPGFSVQTRDPDHARNLPRLLRLVADDIERNGPLLN